MSDGARVRWLTPTRPGGIGVIELSGTHAADVLAKCVDVDAVLPSAGTMRLARIVAEPSPPSGKRRGQEGRPAEGQATVDEVLICRVPCDETIYEINCHGGSAAARGVISRLIDCGAEESDASDFELGRRMRKLERMLFDQLLDARTTRAAEVLLVQLTGTLRAELAAIEASADARPAEAIERVGSLRASFRFGRRLMDPATVVVTGAPNVGKSTLANALVGRSRSIVHHLPGTTRDAVRSVASLAGVPAVVVDTAGLREATEEIERIGISVALDEARACDLVVWVFDHSRPIRANEAAYLHSLRSLPVVAVINKIDLEGPLGEDEVRGLVDAEVLRTCALTGRGVDALREKMVSVLVGKMPPREAAVVTLPSLAEELDEASRRLSAGEKRVRFAMIHEED